jgi:hypothetical protein
MTALGKSAGHGTHALDERPAITDINKQRSASIRKNYTDKILSGATSGRVVDSRGYARLRMACHPRRDINTNYMYEHIIAAEICLGRELEDKEIVHHMDGDKSNSHYANLVVFPSQTLHNRFHAAVRRGLSNDRDSAALFYGVACKRPSLSKGGPHWMQALGRRVLADPRSMAQDSATQEYLDRMTTVSS